MLIFGIIAIATGKFSLNRNRVVEGTNARIVSVVLILPVPLIFLLVFVLVAAGIGARTETWTRPRRRSSRLWRAGFLSCA
jgi:hypothetical protein